MKDADQQNSNLEDEFEKAVKGFRTESSILLKQSDEILEKLIELSEKYGVPFQSPISCLYNEYTPKSFQEQFGELNKSIASEISGVYSDYSLNYPGWAHSEVC